MERSDVVIIGGLAVGPKTAATLARRNGNLKITVFEKSKYISVATCGMPYFASGDIDSFGELMNTSYDILRDVPFFKNTKGFDVVPEAEVTKINREEKFVEVIAGGETIKHGYDKLVIATGSTPTYPPFEIPDSDKISHFVRPDEAIAFRKAAQTGQIGKAVIIGAGLIGCELAEAVGGMWGIETVMIEKENQILPYVLDPEMSDIAIRELKRNDVELHLGCTVEKIMEDNDELKVILSNGTTINADHIFLCLGVRPNINLAKECGLEITATGSIKVDETLVTSDPDIYAGGDCVESISLITGQPIYIPMGSLANRHGKIIAENIVGNKSTFKRITGSFFIKVYDTNVGAVGLSEEAARRAGIETRAVWGAFPDKPDYYPESAAFSLKMIIDKDEKLLGLQAVGEGDICRRIDSFSLMLANHYKVDDIFNFEPGYAPPFAEALDPLHHLAGMAKALSSGIIFDSPTYKNDDCIWLDVREKEETEKRKWNELDKVKESGRYLNIPLNELRENLDKIDRNSSIRVLCRRGPRSYQAALILRQAGFEKVMVLGGGTKAAVS